MSVVFVFGFLLLWSGPIFAFGSSEEGLDSTELHEACVAESGVDEAILNMCTPNSCPDDPNLKCYLKCTLTEMEIMNEDGEIDVETFVEMISDDYTEAAEMTIRGCGTVKGVDDCDTAYLTTMCWIAKGDFLMESITASYEAII